MLLCLSSGARRRYREDVLRALAMPRGASLHFRYESRLLADSLKGQLADNRLANYDVCIAYLDKRDPLKVPEIVPCRAAKLVASKMSGDMYLLTFRLGEFFIANDIAAFNAQVRSESSVLPKWSGGNDVEGFFCDVLPQTVPSLRRTVDIGDWQTLVTTLKKHEDFAGEPFFYHVTDVVRCDNRTTVDLVTDAYVLNAGKAYELKLVQYSPGGSLDALTVGESYWLIIGNQDEEMSFLTPKTLAIDSPYDEQFVRFRPAPTASKMDTSITVLRQSSAGPPDASKAVWDFDLSFRISPNNLSLALKGILIGGLLAVQGVIAIATNPNMTDKLWPSVLVAAAGIFAGLVASFGLRKF